MTGNTNQDIDKWLKSKEKELSDIVDKCKELREKNKGGRK